MNPCNNGILTGRIASEIKFSETVKASKTFEQVFFIIAVKDNFKSNGTYKSKFFPVVAWRNTAKFIRDNFVKGQMVSMNYSLTTRDTMVNSKRNTVVGIKCEDVVFLESKQAVQNKHQKNTVKENNEYSSQEEDNESYGASYSNEVSDEALENFMGAYGVNQYEPY